MNQAPLNTTFVTSPFVETPMTDASMTTALPLDYMTLCRRYQPMGMRLIVDLPFIANDETPLFAIKVSPFIPLLPGTHVDSVAGLDLGSVYNPVYPLPGQAKGAPYTFNYDGTTLSNPVKGVYCVQYDQPPIFSQVSQFFRYWRGSIQYRLRCVSNFTVQGYIQTSIIKQGTTSEVVANCRNRALRTSILDAAPIHNTYSIPAGSLSSCFRRVRQLNSGFRTTMLNSYSMQDISMFRHLEVSVPYENNLEWYDQLMSHRELFDTIYGGDSISWKTGEFVRDYVRLSPLVTRNSSDQFIVVQNRGGLTSPTEGAQIVFELEYCAGPDFQFSQELPLNCDSEYYTDWQARDLPGLGVKYPNVFPSQTDIKWP